MGNPQASLGQGQANPATSQPPNSQQGIMMSQTNTMAMGGGQITQNVVTSTSQSNINPNQQPNVGVLGQQVSFKPSSHILESELFSSHV